MPKFDVTIQGRLPEESSKTEQFTVEGVEGVNGMAAFEVAKKQAEENEGYTNVILIRTVLRG